MTIELDPEIKVLRAKMQDSLDDGFITDYDYIDENGDKIKSVATGGPDSQAEIDSNVSKLYKTAPSTTGDISLLLMEAELVADGVELSNVHIPIDSQTKVMAKKRIEQEELTPAWRE